MKKILTLLIIFSYYFSQAQTLDSRPVKFTTAVGMPTLNTPTISSPGFLNYYPSVNKPAYFDGASSTWKYILSESTASLTYLPLAGGQMLGNIQFLNNSSSSTTKTASIIFSKNTDGANLYYESSGDGDGDSNFIIDLTDNLYGSGQTEGMIIRKTGGGDTPVSQRVNLLRFDLTRFKWKESDVLTALSVGAGLSYDTTSHALSATGLDTKLNLSGGTLTGLLNGNDITLTGNLITNQVTATNGLISQLAVGNVGITSGIRSYFDTGADAAVGIVIKGYTPTQTGDLQQWRNSSGTIISRVTAAGKITSTVVPVNAEDLTIKSYVDSKAKLSGGNLFKSGSNIFGYTAFPGTDTLQVNGNASIIGSIKMLHPEGGYYHTINAVAGTTMRTHTLPDKDITFAGTEELPIPYQFSTTADTQGSFTVTIGQTMPNTNYIVSVTPTSSVAASFCYVTNKTTTTFDVVYLSILTGIVSFEGAVFK